MNIKRTNKLKTNSSGFGHIEMLLLVVAVVVIGGVGFFVYQNQNKKTASKSTAHAGGYTIIGTSSGITASACKTYNSAWGGFYAVKVLFTKAATAPPFPYSVDVHNGITGAISQEKTSNAYWAGTVAAVTVKISVVSKDGVWIDGDYYIHPGDGIQNAIYINKITNC